MARDWWYWTTYRCPECGVMWDEYDVRGANYDSGYSGPVPTQPMLCAECGMVEDLKDSAIAAE